MADFEIIEEGTLDATSNTIDFTSIPQTYTHLEIMFSARSAKAGNTTNGGEVRVNNDSGSNYGVQGGYINNVMSLNMATRTQIDSATRIQDAGAQPGVHAINKIMIPNYTDTTVATKGLLFETTAGGPTSAAVYWNSFAIGFWSSTAAIDQVTLYSESVSYPFIAGCSYWLGGWA
tara:strand:+ start:280 stop:804 length:525 start_codon:yes stop_codon:yes gene_type:complete